MAIPTCYAPNGCDYASGICIYSHGESHWKIQNNTLIDCGTVGIGSGKSYNDIANNTITGRITYPIWYQIGEGGTGSNTDNEIYGNTIYDINKGLTAEGCAYSQPPYTCPISTGDGHGNIIFFGGCTDGCTATWDNTRIYNNTFYVGYNSTHASAHSPGFIQYAAESNACYDGFYFYNNVVFNQMEAQSINLYVRPYPDADNPYTSFGCIKNIYILNNTMQSDQYGVGPIVLGDSQATPSRWEKTVIENNVLKYYNGFITVPFQSNMDGPVTINYNNYYADPSVQDKRFWSEYLSYKGQATFVQYYWTDSPSWKALGYDASSLGPYSDPLFKSTTVGSPCPVGYPNCFDLRLSSASSPANNTGVNLTSLCSNPNLAELCFDKDGNPRPTSGAWDMGAYEYVSGAPPDTTPPAAPTGVTVN